MPLTLIVLVFWKLWIGRVNKGGLQTEEEMRKAEIAAYQGIRDLQGMSSGTSQDQRAYLSDSPLYPMARLSRT